MKKLEWKMEEVFYFPTDVGVPTDNGTVKVTAGFTENRTEDAVRLTGIYHIAAQVDFSDGQRVDELPEEVVFMDDVELEGQSGYFEYAVPLYVDLPPEVSHPLNIEATNVQTKTDENGALTVSWSVACSYDEAKEELAVEEFNDSTKTVQNEPKENKVQTVASQNSETLVQEKTEAVMHDSSSWNDQDDILSYISALPDEWVTTSFRSNDVFVQQES